MDYLRSYLLSEEEKNFACAIINSTSTGSHPVARLKTIGGFGRDFLVELIEKNMNSILMNCKPALLMSLIWALKK